MNICKEKGNRHLIRLINLKFIIQYCTKKRRKLLNSHIEKKTRMYRQQHAAAIAKITKTKKVLKLNQTYRRLTLKSICCSIYAMEDAPLQSIQSVRSRFVAFLVTQ